MTPSLLYNSLKKPPQPVPLIDSNSAEASFTAGIKHSSVLNGQHNTVHQRPSDGYSHISVSPQPMKLITCSLRSMIGANTVEVSRYRLQAQLAK